MMTEADDPNILNPVLQSIWTMRSVRTFRPDSVKYDDLQLVLKAGTMAASGGNSQPWIFVVLRDKKKKQEVQRVVSKKWHAMIDAAMGTMPQLKRRIYEAASSLVDHTSEVPLVILACLDVSKSGRGELMGSNIYPSVQNMMLAAWSLGLGTCLTTHGCSPERGEDEVKEILGIPEYVKVAAFLYLGHPARSLSPPSRRSLDEVVHYDGW